SAGTGANPMVSGSQSPLLVPTRDPLNQVVFTRPNVMSLHTEAPPPPSRSPHRAAAHTLLPVAKEQTADVQGEGHDNERATWRRMEDLGSHRYLVSPPFPPRLPVPESPRPLCCGAQPLAARMHALRCYRARPVGPIPTARSTAATHMRRPCPIAGFLLQDGNVCP